MTALTAHDFSARACFIPSARMLDPHVPSVAEIQSISTMTDPVLRNLRITQAYHELAVHMTTRTGEGGANWAAFAAWASKQAGQSIRKEDFARVFENLLHERFGAGSVNEMVKSARAYGSRRKPEEIHETVFSLVNPLAVLNRVSEAVSRGNKKVFDEIAYEYARFYETCFRDAVYDEASITRFTDGMLPGDPPEGQALLRQAFRHYYRAIFEQDAKIRAELMFMANMKIGLHEQTRLQCEITEALEGSMGSLKQFHCRLIDALFPECGRWGRIRLAALRVIDVAHRFDRVLDALFEEARRRVRLLVTEYVMRIELPCRVLLRLSQDVPGEFPDPLKQITLPELRELLTEFDQSPDSLKNTGATDWSILPDRMHFIIDLFRRYHMYEDLYNPVFTDAQVEAMNLGIVPVGRL